MESNESERAGKSILTVGEAAALTGLKPSTIYAYAERRKIPHMKVGTRLLFDAKQLTEWLDSHRVPISGENWPLSAG